MPRYNHVFEIAFSVDTDEADGLKVTAEELWAAFCRRLADITHDDIVELASWSPSETVDNGEPPAPPTFNVEKLLERNPPDEAVWCLVATHATEADAIADQQAREYATLVPARVVEA